MYQNTRLALTRVSAFSADFSLLIWMFKKAWSQLFTHLFTLRKIRDGQQSIISCFCSNTIASFLLCFICLCCFIFPLFHYLRGSMPFVFFKKFSPFYSSFLFLAWSRLFFFFFAFTPNSPSPFPNLSVFSTISHPHDLSTFWTTPDPLDMLFRDIPYPFPFLLKQRILLNLPSRGKPLQKFFPLGIFHPVFGVVRCDNWHPALMRWPFLSCPSLGYRLFFSSSHRVSTACRLPPAAYQACFSALFPCPPTRPPPPLSHTLFFLPITCFFAFSLSLLISPYPLPATIQSRLQNEHKATLTTTSTN